MNAGDITVEHYVFVDASGHAQPFDTWDEGEAISYAQTHHLRIKARVFRCVGEEDRDDYTPQTPIERLESGFDYQPIAERAGHLCENDGCNNRARYRNGDSRLCFECFRDALNSLRDGGAL